MSNFIIHALKRLLVVFVLSLILFVSAQEDKDARIAELEQLVKEQQQTIDGLYSKIDALNNEIQRLRNMCGPSGGGQGVVASGGDGGITGGTPGTAPGGTGMVIALGTPDITLPPSLTLGDLSIRIWDWTPRQNTITRPILIYPEQVDKQLLDTYYKGFWNNDLISAPYDEALQFFLNDKDSLQTYRQFQEQLNGQDVAIDPLRFFLNNPESLERFENNFNQSPP